MLRACAGGAVDLFCSTPASLPTYPQPTTIHPTARLCGVRCCEGFSQCPSQGSGQWCPGLQSGGGHVQEPTTACSQADAAAGGVHRGVPCSPYQLITCQFRAAWPCPRAALPHQSVPGHQAWCTLACACRRQNGNNSGLMVQQHWYTQSPKLSSWLGVATIPPSAAALTAAHHSARKAVPAVVG